MSMDLTPLVPVGRQMIESYGDGRFKISGTVYEGSVLVLPDRTLAWPIASLSEINADSLAAVLDARATIELLLFGCGTRMVQIPRFMRQLLGQAGLAVEPMDTGAACRTYNVLAAEERRVAAALIAV
jgi:uncharacterized protein